MVESFFQANAAFKLNCPFILNLRFMIASQPFTKLRAGVLLLLFPFVSHPGFGETSRSSSVSHQVASDGTNILLAGFSLTDKEAFDAETPLTLEIEWESGILYWPVDVTSLTEEGETEVDVPLPASANGQRLNVQFSSDAVAMDGTRVVSADKAAPAKMALEAVDYQRGAQRLGAVLRSSRPLQELPASRAFSLRAQELGEKPLHPVVSRIGPYRFRVEFAESIPYMPSVTLVFHGGGKGIAGRQAARQSFSLSMPSQEGQGTNEARATAANEPQAATSATPLTLTESPSGSGYLSAYASGSFSAGGESNAVNYQIELAAGDELSVYTNAVNQSATARLQLFSPEGDRIHGGYNGTPYPIQRYEIDTPGSYRLKFWMNDAVNYQVRVDVGRGQSIESEQNDSLGNANTLSFSQISGGYQAKMGGALTELDSNPWFDGSNDTLGDFYHVGTINSGNSVDITYALPSFSSLASGDLEIALFREGQQSPVAISTTASGLSHTVSTGGDFSVRVAINDNLDGTSLEFGGEGDRADLPAAVLDGRDDLTVEFWARGQTNGRAVLSAAQSSEDNELLFWIDDSTTIEITDKGSSYTYTVPEIDQQTWRHYALVRDTSAETLELFVDGESQGTKSTTLNTLSVENLVLGQDQDSVGSGYQSYQAMIGHMDDLRVWNTVRTVSEIQNNQKTALNGDETGLVAYWQFNEGSGTSILDETANNYDGTLSDATFSGDVNAAGFNPANLGLQGQYLATATVSDSIAPTIADTSLPDPSNTDLYQNFDISFSEDMTPSTVEEASNYSLYEAGPDGTLGTTDDAPYEISVAPYNRGTEATLILEDGPLQPGSYRFEAGGTLADRAGNTLTSYTLDFTLNQLGDYIIENRSNENRAGATPLAQTFSPAHDGTFTQTSATDLGGTQGFALVNVDGDSLEEVLNLNASNDSIEIYDSDGQGSFSQTHSYSLPDRPTRAAIGDFNDDGLEDLGVAVIGDDEVHVLLNNGDGTLSAQSGVSVQNGPEGIAAGDFNGDGADDLVTANRYADSLSILISDGAGGFSTSSISSLDGSIPYAVVAAKIDSDNHTDIAFTDTQNNRLAFMKGAGDGSFAAPTYRALDPDEDDPEALGVADLDTDGAQDLVVLFDNGYTNAQASVFLGNNDGTFLNPRRLPIGDLRKELVLTDINGDGTTDLVVANSYNVRYWLGTGQRSNLFGGRVTFGDYDDAWGLGAGDFDGDGRTDLLVATSDSDNLNLLSGNPTITPMQDSGISSLRQALGRGSLSDQDDVDYFKFSAAPGDKMALVVRVPTADANYNRLQYRLFDSTGSRLETLVGDYQTGRGQINPVTLDAGGTYYLRVEEYDDYFYEYRFRVTLAPEDYQVEGEDNDSISNANDIDLAFNGGALEASVLGQGRSNDSSGDYFQLGNFAEGANISLTFQNTEDSSLTPKLWIYTGDDVVRAEGNAGETTLSYSVTSSTAGTYYARVRGEDGTRGFFGEYVLDISVGDSVDPEIVSDTLPANGTSVDTMINTFSLSVSEDLLASSVNDLSAYDLRAKGPDGSFGTADDPVYPLQAIGYSSGQSIDISLIDGPLQAGEYRLTVSAGSLEDRFGNTLPTDYIRTFTITGLPPFITESRSNDSRDTADSLSGNPLPSHDGSFEMQAPINTSVDWRRMVTRDFDGDGNADLALITTGDDSLKLFMGNGDGSFGTPVSYSLSQPPHDIVAADFDGQTRVDLAVVTYASDEDTDGQVVTFLNDGSGGFTQDQQVGVGNYARRLTVGMWNSDSAPDLAVSNQGYYSSTQGSLTILTNDGSGTFAASTVHSGSGIKPHGIGSGDFDGSNGDDLVFTDRENNRLGVILNGGSGNFSGSITWYDLPDDIPTALDVGDLSGDGNADVLVGLDNNDAVAYLLGDGSGSLDSYSTVHLNNYDAREVRLLDIDDSGTLDVVVGGSEGLTYRSTRQVGSGFAFASVVHFEPDYNDFYGVVAADFNEDGRTDLAAAENGDSRFYLFFGQQDMPLASVAGINGLREAYFRGRGPTSEDDDYFMFSGNAGDKAIVSALSLDGAYSSHNVRLLDSDGDYLAGTDIHYGEGETNPVTLPYSGRYFIEVRANNGHTGEYRVRVSVLPSSVQIENEGNDNDHNANSLQFAQAPGTRTARIFANYNTADNHDYFEIGNLANGATVSYDFSQPSDSPMTPTLKLFADGDNSATASAASGATSFSYSLVEGEEDLYYARVEGDGSSQDLFSRYLLEVQITDSQAPEITNDSLIDEGDTTETFIVGFSLTFSEDMEPDTVNDPASYDLRAAGADTDFDTADDIVYSVQSQTYSNGSSASFTITDGPLQPGRYRLEIEADNLTDLFGNPLSEDFSRVFIIENLQDFAAETRDNDSFETAASLMGPPQEASDGSYKLSSTAAAGNNLRALGLLDANDDGAPDLLAAATDSSMRLMLYTNDGSGTYSAPASLPAFSSSLDPQDLVTADFTGDGVRDFAISLQNYSNDELLVFENNKDGTFTQTASFDSYLNPERIAVADLDGDTDRDMVVRLDVSPSAVLVLLNDGSGGFSANKVEGFPSNAQLIDVALGKADSGDAMDLFIANEDTAELLVRLGDGSGGFDSATTFSLGDGDPQRLASGDFDGDGNIDVAVGYDYGNVLDIFRGDGSGGFNRVGLQLGDYEEVRDLLATDLDGDGTDDLIAGTSRQAGVYVFYGKSYGIEPLTRPSAYDQTPHAESVVAGDLDDDGANEFIAANRDDDQIAIFEGRGNIFLQNDSNVVGLRYALARGTMRTGDGSNDEDYWTFSSLGGDRFFFATQNTSTAYYTDVSVEVYGPGELRLDNFGTDRGGGEGQNDPLTLGGPGRHFIRIRDGRADGDEYRFVVNLLPAPVQTEEEYNDDTSSATQPSFAASAGQKTAEVFGTIDRRNDRDHYLLGNLAPGTQIKVNMTLPGYSLLDPSIEIYRDGESALASSTQGDRLLEATVPAGQGGAYYVKFDEFGDSGGYRSTYHARFDLLDNAPPDIVSTTLPQGGATAFISSFDITLSEDFDPATINDTSNYELLHAGSDSTFGTSDDSVIPLSLASNYSSGSTVSLNIGASPLTPGQYRFEAGTGLADLYGNPLPSPYQETFTVNQASGFTTETDSNNSTATATTIQLTDGPAGLVSGGLRGRLVTSGENDYWSFDATSGQSVVVAVDHPGSPGGSEIEVILENPDGSELNRFTSDNGGNFTSTGAIALSQTGTHIVRIARFDNFSNEYRVRLTLLDADESFESEANNTVGAANALSLTSSGNSRTGDIYGTISDNADLDYYDLGTVTDGESIFLNATAPPNSPLIPSVAVYNSSGAYVSEATGGRSGDAVAQVDITSDGNYFALVRNSGQTGGLMSEYRLNVEIAPADTTNYANLQVSSVTIPTGSDIESGDTINFGFTVENLGNASADTPPWRDRVVVSGNAIFGDGDDLELASYDRSTALTSGNSYSVSDTATLPDGIDGDFFLVVKTDVTAAVAEFVFEGDNVTASNSTFNVSRADYPDLVVENLNVNIPSPGADPEITWDTANNGDANAVGGLVETIDVVDRNSGNLIASVNKNINQDLAAGGSIQRSHTLPDPGAGNYRVFVTTDADAEFFEFGSTTHEEAEANEWQTDFTVYDYFNVAVNASPASGGSVSGGGVYRQGNSVTVQASPDTSSAPYAFSNWSRATGELVSTQATHTFTPTQDESLIASFVLPSYGVSITKVLPEGGVVTGSGSYSHGSTATLTADPNPGYLFTEWQENGSTVTAVDSLDLTITSSRSLTAVFEEENPTHTVTVESAPTGIVSLSGDGTYDNGESLSLSAPATKKDGATEYLFQEWLANGQRFSASENASKTFSTLDPASITYTARYDSRSFKPTVAQSTPSVDINVPVTASETFSVTLVFDRAMDTNVAPTIELSSSNAASVPAFPTGGSWVSEDTWESDSLTFGVGNTGDYTLTVRDATDIQGRTMDPADVFTFTVDVDPPALPAVSLGATTASTAELIWSGYSAPSDLQGFHIHLQTEDFSTVEPADARTGTGSNSRAYTLTGLQLDTQYYAAVVALDTADNFNDTVSTLAFTLESDVPPPVSLTVSQYTPDGLTLDWSAYQASSLLGFEGFHVYRAESPFSDVSGMTPVATLPTTATSYTATGLDRAKTYYFAVTGYNREDEENTAVSTVEWTDPVAGAITTDRTFGGDGATVEVRQPLTVRNGATLTFEPGTTVYFDSGAGIVVENGVLDAQGTALDPIVFTSANDQQGASTSPQPGDWTGVTLSDATQASKLSHLWISYGEGLELAGATPQAGPLAMVRNSGAGLSVSSGNSLSLSDIYLVFNDTGVSVQGAGTDLTLTDSVIKNNTSQAALTAGGGTLDAQGNWWGTDDASAIAASVSGTVDTASPLSEEPLLGTGFDFKGGRTQTTNDSVTLEIASFNASAYRVSEDSAFSNTLFDDIFAPSAVNTYSRQPWEESIQLSAGTGMKTIHLELLSPTGGLTETDSVSLTKQGQGPMIQGFNLAEGDVIERPYEVTASATAPLGVDTIGFYVNGTKEFEVAGNALSERWNIAGLSSGIYRISLEARDTEGNLAQRDFNVTVSPTPPPAPAMDAPLDGDSFTVSTTSVSGTAESNVPVRILTNGAVVASGQADGAGQFSFPSVSLFEGQNELIAVAHDAAGSTQSPGVSVVSDTMGPLPVEIEEPVYDPEAGLLVQWRLSEADGEQPTRFEVFWDTQSFTDVADAADSSGITEEQSYAFESEPDQHYYFRVVGYDAADNASAPSDMVEATLDETPPVIDIFYNKAMPVGAGDLEITLKPSEPLSETPSLAIEPANMRSPVSIPLTPNDDGTYSGIFPVSDTSANSGEAEVKVGAVDLDGNKSLAAPNGKNLVIDLTRPIGELRFSREQPIQVQTTKSVDLRLELSEPLPAGDVPSLKFSPPSGADVDITLTDEGNHQFFTGQLTLFPSMGRGEGLFLMEAVDPRGNTGTVLDVGETLEIYNTPLPIAPEAPHDLIGETLAGGEIRLLWPEVKKARTYNIYRVPSGESGIPDNRVKEGHRDTEFTDLPATDGDYRYVVTASRLGAEGDPSPATTLRSDRVAPAAPQNAQASLAYNGVEIIFDKAPGEPEPHHWVLYRNGTALDSAHAPTRRSITDVPPRGEMDYQVAASDSYGNHALSNTASIEMFVGAVRDIVATVASGSSVSLTWQNTDNQSTGYKVYRNGVLQTPTAITDESYDDPIALGDSPVTYAVTAVGNADRESVAREIVVQPLDIGFAINPTGSGLEESSVVGFFDNYQLSLDNQNGNGQLDFTEIDVARNVGSDSLSETYPFGQQIAAGAAENASVPVPAPAFSQSGQSIALTLRTDPADDGSFLRYEVQRNFTKPITRPAAPVEIKPVNRPLAGGLSDFEITLKNLGEADADFILARDSGSEAGDLEISVQTESGQELSVTEPSKLINGLIFSGNNDAILRLAPDETRTFTVEDVFVPASLSDADSASFVASVDPIYYGRGGNGERESGPVSGTTQATPRQTAYYGTASTQRSLYSNEETITITGQAIDRSSGNPLPDTELRLGFNVQGFVFREEIATDSSGNYSFDYDPSQAIAGEISIWAAHPDIVDQLDQVSVSLYRSFISPSRGDIRMSKSDTLDFDLTLINPGDEPLTDVTLSARAYVVEQDGSETEISSLDGVLREPLPSNIPGGSETPVQLQLQSTLNAPDDAVIELTLTSSEGAASTFVGNVALLPAIPVLSVESPEVGYVDMTVDKGELRSRTVTIVNEGLRPLEDPVLTPPQNIDWMHVNRPLNDQGKAELEDIPVGGELSVTVIYTPPEDVSIGYHDDKLVVSGSNAVSDFELGLYSQVGSSQSGDVRFAIDNTLVQPIPNATVRLRNVALGVNKGPFKTDAQGEVLVEDLQEGKWSYKVSAPSHNVVGGTVEVVPDQTVLVEERLYKSLVTVKFNVVPKPFTDRYDIKIEQTFETRVPAPVLVLDPPQYTFDDPPDGFETTVVYTLKNEGLISVFDVKIGGMQMEWGVLEPLVKYIPEVGAQDQVEIPIRVKIYEGAEPFASSAGNATAGTGTNAPEAAGDKGPLDPGGGLPDSAACFAGVPGEANADFARGAAALIQAAWNCNDGDTAMHALSAAIVANSILNAAVSNTPAAAWAGYLARAAGCLTNLITDGSSTGNGGGGAPPPNRGGPSSYGEGSACFAADTPVLLADGSEKAISEVEVGDAISTGAHEASRDQVVDVVEFDEKKLTRLVVKPLNGGPEHSLDATREHRFWIDGDGWKSVRALEKGDWVHLSDGSLAELVEKEPLEGRHHVYTLQIEDDTVFYANDILVQDACGQFALTNETVLLEGGQEQ